MKYKYLILFGLIGISRLSFGQNLEFKLKCLKQIVTYHGSDHSKDQLFFNTSFIQFDNNLITLKDSASNAIFSLVVKKFEYNNENKIIRYFGKSDAYLNFDVLSKNVIYMMGEQSDFNMQYRGCVIIK